MNPSERNGKAAPTPERLAAYADGELNAEAAADVADWLHRHPDVAADVEGQRRLRRLWEKTAPEEPSVERWHDVFARIESSLTPIAPKRGRRWSPRLWAAVVLLPAVAAAVLAVVLLRTPPPSGPGIQVAVEEPLPVLSADEVLIISMDDADRHRLIVGAPPVTEPLALLTSAEVTVNRIEGDDDGGEPEFSPQWPTPMIIMPRRSPEAKEQ